MQSSTTTTGEFFSAFRCFPLPTLLFVHLAGRQGQGKSGLVGHHLPHTSSIPPSPSLSLSIIHSIRQCSICPCKDRTFFVQPKFHARLRGMRILSSHFWLLTFWYWFPCAYSVVNFYRVCAREPFWYWFPSGIGCSHSGIGSRLVLVAHILVLVPVWYWLLTFWFWFPLCEEGGGEERFWGKVLVPQVLVPPVI